ncbi:MAG: 50S ribosomal protein L9 [Chloroflexota bacterium]
MKVVFLQEVPGTALPGEVKEVKDGFARNYLLPRGLAVPATKDALERAQALAKREERRQAALDAEARRIVEQLTGHTVTIAARVGEQGRLYGSVTAADIAGKLSELLGSEFDRRRIHLPQPIRELGTRMVTLRLSRNVSFELPVTVVAEESHRHMAAAAPETSQAEMRREAGA